MSDDLKKNVVEALRDSANIYYFREPTGERGDALHALARRLEAAEVQVREPSLLERVQAALPEGWEARHYGTDPQSRIWIGGPHGTCGYTYSEQSRLTPEEAVECAKKLAGVE